MHKDSNPVKRLVYVGTQYDDKYISRELKKEGFRELEAVKLDGNNIELAFSGELNYKPKKRVIQFSKKKHSNLENSLKKLFLNETSSKPFSKAWKILEIIEFPNKWLVFLTE